MEETTKIKDLTPESRRVNVLAKVVSIGEPKQIQTRFGEEKSVTEVYIGDDTGKIILSLWGEQAGQATDDKTIFIENGYISLVRGHMRLNVGKYGSLKDAEEELPEVNDELDMSEQEHENTYRRRPFSGGGSGGSGGSRGRGGFYNQNRGSRPPRDDFND